MYKVAFELKGLTALLMHHDNVMECDRVKEWRGDSANRNELIPGDDRTPRWAWSTYLYTDADDDKPAKFVTMPSCNLMSCLRTAGAKIILKKQKTFKELTQSGMFCQETFLDFLYKGEKIKVADIEKLLEKPFEEQCKGVNKLGFHLLIKPVQVNRKRHVRVRPKFRQGEWVIKGTVQVIAPEITMEILERLFDEAGKIGLGDWRPGSPKPGCYGMFESKIKKIG
jgi:hypothetical protein